MPASKFALSGSHDAAPATQCAVQGSPLQGSQNVLRYHEITTSKFTKLMLHRISRWQMRAPPIKHPTSTRTVRTSSVLTVWQICWFRGAVDCKLLSMGNLFRFPCCRLPCDAVCTNVARRSVTPSPVTLISFRLGSRVLAGVPLSLLVARVVACGGRAWR